MSGRLFDHNSPMKIYWSRIGSVVVLMLFTGCTDGAKLVQEQANGGVVIYPFKDGQGSLLSAFRKDALAIIKEKCGGRPCRTAWSVGKPSFLQDAGDCER